MDTCRILTSEESKKLQHRLDRMLASVRIYGLEVDEGIATSLRGVFNGKLKRGQKRELENGYRRERSKE